MQFFFVPDQRDKFMYLRMQCFPLLESVLLESDKNLVLYTFSIFLIATSAALGSGTNGSAV
jgi:hypothetical protein